jgi:hypothetical protein
MNMDWNGYEIYDPGVVGALNMLPRAEARKAFERLMRAKSARVEILRRVLRANGVDLGSSEVALQDLNDWFYDNVEPDPENLGRLRPEWYSISSDIGLFLGDVLVGRCPGLRWDFFTWGRKDVSFQRHVIMGFSQVPNPKYNVDFGSAVATYGHRIVAKRGSVSDYGTVTVRGAQIDVDVLAEQHRSREIETDAFWRWLRNAESEA